MTTSSQASFLFRYSLQSLAVIFLVAMFMRTFMFSSYVMTGVAMLPSILPGDFLVASKVRAKQLKRGAVVALRCPVPKDKLCIKRIVGLPGDRIEFRGNNLILNGQAAKYVASGAFETEIVDGMGWAIWPGKAEKGIGEAVVLPPQQIYVLNDKRSDLEDSRVWGPVAVDYLEARVQRVWMSLDWYDGNKVRLWPRIRWERLFRSID